MIIKAFEKLVGNNIRLELHGSTYEDVVWLDERDMPSKDVWQVEFDILVSEIPLNELREVRNNKLAESDWRMTIDYEGTDQEEWKTYRRALRDITNTYASLDDVVWPDEPAK